MRKKLFSILTIILLFLVLSIILIGCSNENLIESKNELLNDLLIRNISSENISNDSNIIINSTNNIIKNIINTSGIIIPKEISNSWYLPKPGISWQWQLSGKIDIKYDVDLYDVDLVETSQNTIDELHSRGIKVICYFSGGSYEDYREDAPLFPKEVLGNTLDDWPDEKWLDISNYDLFADIMENRLDLAVQKNCDGVEPDNVDGFQNDNGFKLTYEDQLEYNKWLSAEAHKRNLSIALKNDLDQIADLVDYFDFAINEECFYYDECESLLLFIEKNKAVIGVEYELDSDEFCNEANNLGFGWLKMDYDLDGTRISCK